MKPIYLCLLSPLFFTACGDGSSAHDHGGADTAASSSRTTVAPENPVQVVDGVTVVEMTGNDQMKFNLEAFSVPAGGQVKLTFRNVGKMPKAAMGHNVVFLDKDAKVNAFASAAAAARENDYLPTDPELKEQILAATAMLGPGESDTIEFTAPSEPGAYEFICSFPAHMFAGMRGVMTVE
jgi:azurin